MQQESQEARGKLLTFIVTRDSVCAGDDCDAPHEKRVEAYATPDAAALLRELATGYLATVGGFGHSWECLLNGNRIAIIWADGTAMKDESFEYEETNRVHFKYNSATF